MNANDLYERRAERGRHRGAAAVWADAHHDVHAEQATSSTPEQSPRWWSVASFRVAFVALSLAALAALTIPLDVFDTEADEVATPAIEDEAEEATVEEAEPPAQLLIEGMTLKTIFEPDSERQLDGGDSFVIPLEPFGASFIGARLSVFTDQTDPYGNPVLIGTRSESGEGVAVISGNVPFAESVIEFNDGAWQLIDQSGDYALVAEFDGPDQVRLNAWEFGFVDSANGSDQAVWQAAEHDGAGEWSWIVRLVDGDTSLRPIEVLGGPGVELIDKNGDSHVIWTAGDVAYRMTAFSSDEDSLDGVGSAELASRLYESDDDEWGRAVDDADGSIISVRVDTVEVPVSYVASGLGVLIAGGFLGWFVYTQRSSAQKEEHD